MALIKKGFANSGNLLLLGCYTALIAVVLVSCSNQHTEPKEEAIVKDTLIAKVRPMVSELNQTTIALYALTNPCYLPLLRDTTYYLSGKPVGFSFSELFNDRLPVGHPFGNRYLVGDFNVLDSAGNPRGVEERYPELRDLIEFNRLDSAVIFLLDSARQKQLNEDDLTGKLKMLGIQLPDTLLNFYHKVWKFRTPPLTRKYGISGQTVYAAGQKLCMCEARQDTLLFHGQFAISAKRQSPTEDGRMVESLPLGKSRKYYGARYYISSKNWERQRKYEPLDIARDSAVGGGNNQITVYKGKVELPNFMLLEPHPTFKGAMRSNGIHEVALSQLSRGMLGAPNSIGCIRVTDFGSKFLRWWTPQDCNFFILYQEDKYVKKMTDLNAADLRPFKSQQDGDRFRTWINATMPEQAEYWEVDPTGDFKSEYLIDAYIAHKAAYDQWLSSQAK
jgi:hypothetical protein